MHQHDSHYVSATKQKCRICSRIMGVNATGICRECSYMNCAKCTNKYRVTIKKIGSKLCYKCRQNRPRQDNYNDYPGESDYKIE